MAAGREGSGFGILSLTPDVRNAEGLLKVCRSLNVPCDGH